MQIKHYLGLLGVAYFIKLLLDFLISGTILSALLIDPVLIVTAYILFRNTTVKTMFLLFLIEGITSYFLFPDTDIWYLRPISILIAYLIVKFLRKKKFGEKTKLLTTCFFTGKFTVITYSMVLFMIFLLYPQDFPSSEVFDGAKYLADLNLINQEDYMFFIENPIFLILASLIGIMFIYAYIPATVNTLILLLILKATKKDNL